ncbi:MAG: UDP-N-acetylenolpyruvoylglucosamine reductase [Micrococcales bacterium 73-15]|uniref:UDP-N-acetylmuramate dehydrogenase n=1 Tax=Salana multivorans TaxID=120377 RepID=UPI000967E389|nr:UDP-N-acetylmuramate dehydrogenase [Salana multivorans]OJX93951.1 MAG: UDP-N-acetylenolpyruvoylglucosamine reductase [Micrococcales bacterium 73-15]
MTTLADLTTLRVGGPVAEYVEATTEAEILDVVRRADAEGRQLLVLGGGSNLLASDEPFDGVVVRDLRRGLALRESSACGGADVVIPAGHGWDDVVVEAIENDWSGIEALSGIPGSVGATPVQNVGAYGQEVGDVLAFVRTWDRGTGRIRTLARSELGLGYRTSILKRSTRDGDPVGDDGEPARRWAPTPRYVVLEVGLQLPLASRSAPVRYAELARTLGVEVGARVPSRDVRAAVLGLRRGKGMVLDAADHDTWSAGSFFTNPIVSDAVAAGLPEGAPRFPLGDGRVKTSAAWLISTAGFERGFGLPGPASLSTKHSLALTNRGTATAADLLALARTVRDGVAAAFGIVLEPEPVLLGVEL